MRGAGERRVVSVLVTDLVDSTSIAERLGAERTKVLFDEVARITDEQVTRYGGTLAQHTGDGVLAVFGAPLSHGDDAERAVRAALGLIEELRAVSDEVAAAYQVTLAVRAAVNTGPVALPAGDQPPDVLYNALGDTVNVAARLQVFAPAGRVVVGPVTAGEIESQFACEPIGDLEIKGRDEPVLAFLVGAERTDTVKPTAPYVGRAAERATVVEAIEGVAEGRGAVVVVTGEPGIGKSRLIAEAVSAAGDRVRVIEGAAVSYAETFPYWPIRSMLRDWLGLASDAPEAQVRLELRAAVNRALGDAAPDSYPFLAAVAGVPLEREAATEQRELSSDGVRARTVDAVRALLAALAVQRPVAVVLDDLHWADEATLELVAHLLVAVDEDGLGLVLGYRSERDHGAWRLGELARQRVPHRYHEVELRGLGREESRQLMASLAGNSVPAEVDDLLCRRAGGNPLFLEQGLRDLLERGLLRRADDGYSLAGDLATTTIPWAVRETLQARLDRLEPGTREVVAVASVLGRTFTRPLIDQLLDGRPISDALSELQRRDLVVEVRRRPVAEYAFRHGLVQEVAYESLLEPHRRQLHQRVGEVLEATLGLECCDDLGLLGHHFAEAGDSARASRYLVRAGDEARRLYADAEALEHYTRALAFQRAEGDDEGARSTLLRLALARHQAFDFAGADAAWAQAFALPEPERDRRDPTETVELPTTATDSVVPGITQFEETVWVSRHLFTGLLRPARDEGVEPDGAVRLSVSPDGRTYRFWLRPSARWHDGTPVTAGDYAFAYRWVKEHRSFGATMLGHVTDVVAVDPHTLEVRLDRPLAFLPQLLAYVLLGPWPRHLWPDGPPDAAVPAGLVGNGPFRLAESGPEGLRLVAAETWDRPRGNIAEVRLPIVTGAQGLAQARREWEQGRYDLSFHADAPGADAVEYSFPKSGVQYLALHARGPLADHRVRSALIRALPPIDDHRGVVRATGGLLPPAVQAHSHDLAMERDVELAARLLDEAGYPQGAGLPILRLMVPEELTERSCDPGRVAVEWARLGVDVQVLRPSHNELGPLIMAGDVDAWVLGWIADSPDPVAMLEGFLMAYPLLAQPEPDGRDLLARAAASTDRDERNSLCRAFERRWIAELAAVKPMAYIGQPVVVRSHLRGFWTAFASAPTLDQLTVVR